MRKKHSAKGKTIKAITSLANNMGPNSIAEELGITSHQTQSTLARLICKAREPATKEEIAEKEEDVPF